MGRYQLTTQPIIEFDDLKVGLVSLVFSALEHTRVRLLDTHSQREWIAVGRVVLPKGSLLTHITPQRREDLMEPDVQDIEVRSCDKVGGRPIKAFITVQQLMCMVADGVARLDCSSGADPNLYYRYDHYLIN